MHLVDHARAHIEETYRRPLIDRTLRAVLAAVLPYPARFRTALRAGALGRVFAPLFAAVGLKPVAAMLRLVPSRLPVAPPQDGRRVFPAEGPRKARVALLRGCAQQVLKPSINDAAIRVLTRLGVEVVLAEGEGCCGALVHHMGREAQALAQARNNVAAWMREVDGAGLDAILITASGCGTTVKDYGFMLREDKAWSGNAARISGLAKDISEFLGTFDLGSREIRRDFSGLTVAYQSACSLQHGQKITRQPKELLVKCGFAVRDVPESHLCCGSAGTYNILQPEIAAKLRDRKVANIAKTGANVVASGNIGCMTQLDAAAGVPVVHTVELVDWALGGPAPESLANPAE
jgi:glycolate oxidase iron-sulfur subunit